MADFEYTVEEWRPIPGIPEYAASCFGRIMRVTPRTSGKVRPLKLIERSDGRFVVNICSVGARRQIGVHRLVCMTFNGQPTETKDLCCHKDGDLRNNRADNLYWGDGVDNMSDAQRHGTFPIGSKNANSKLNEDDVRKILHDPRNQPELAREYGVLQTTISSIRRRKTWRHV